MSAAIFWGGETLARYRQRAISVLLGVTALTCGSLAVVTRGANAETVFEAADDIQDGRSPVINETPAFVIRIAGTLRVDAQWVDQDIQGMGQSFNLDDTTRDISIFGSATADNGLSYGFEYDIDEDRAQIHLSNRFGRVDMGDTDSATDALDIKGDSAMVGRGSWARAGSKNVNLGGIEGLGVVSVRGIGGTIRYTTPNYGGLTIAASFTNESDGDMIDGSGPTTSEDIVSIAGRYISSYGNYTTIVYGGYESSNNGEKVSARGKQEIYSAGAMVVGMGARFAIGWGRTENELAPDAAISDELREWYDIGLSFSSGPWSVSVGGAHVLDESVLLASVIDTEMTAISASFNYNVAPGLALMGGVTHFNIDNGDYTGFTGVALDANGRADNSATTFTLTTQMSF